LYSSKSPPCPPPYPPAKFPKLFLAKCPVRFVFDRNPPLLLQTFRTRRDYSRLWPAPQLTLASACPGASSVVPLFFFQRTNHSSPVVCLLVSHRLVLLCFHPPFFRSTPSDFPSTNFYHVPRPIASLSVGGPTTTAFSMVMLFRVFSLVCLPNPKIIGLSLCVFLFLGSTHTFRLSVRALC